MPENIEVRQWGTQRPGRRPEGQYEETRRNNRVTSPRVGNERAGGPAASRSPAASSSGAAGTKRKPPVLVAVLERIRREC